MPASAGHPVHFLNIYYKQDRDLSPYLFFAVLVVLAFLTGLFLSKNLFNSGKENKLSQLIDIEFVSQSDYKDTKNLLPASQPKPSLAKRTSPVKQSKGQLFVEPVFVVRAANSQNKSKEEQEKPNKQATMTEVFIDRSALANRYVPMNVPFSQEPHLLSAKNLQGKNTEKQQGPMDMEEVKPPELMEVKENEGDETYNHWQDGGSSTKGTGITSSLADYLKVLHSKLKHAWSPPPGTVRHIKVIFRLSKGGNLVSIQLIQSCGDKVADESALVAVKNSAPFGKLPGDYRHQFLDLAYTFNYTTDELSEIHSQSEE